jgi:hypothetical protein
MITPPPPVRYRRRPPASPAHGTNRPAGAFCRPTKASAQVGEFFLQSRVADRIFDAADDVGDKTLEHAAVLQADIDPRLVFSNGFVDAGRDALLQRHHGGLRDRLIGELASPALPAVIASAAT